MKTRGPHTVVSSVIKYKNPWIMVHEDKIIRDTGKEGLYGIVEYSPGVATVALTDKNEVYIVKEYLYAIDEHGACLPGGGVEPNEKPLAAAKKELREEAGVIADSWVALGHVNPYPMVVNGTQHMFLARGARVAGEHEKEFSVLKVPFAEAYNMVMRGEITHAVSCVAILKTKLILDQEN